MKVTYNLLLQYPFLRKWMRKTIIVFNIKNGDYYYFDPYNSNILPGDKFLIDIPKLKFKKGETK